MVMVYGLEAVCQSAYLSVSQQVFIYLSGWRAAHQMVGTRGLPACSLCLWHHPTHSCHINSFSDTILILLNSCPNTFSSSPFPLGRKKIYVAQPKILGLPHCNPSSKRYILSLMSLFMTPDGTTCCFFFNIYPAASHLYAFAYSVPLPSHLSVHNFFHHFSQKAL